jgi:PAS domain S-box-containing protein
MTWNNQNSPDFFKKSNTLCAITDFTGHFLQCNQAWENIFGENTCDELSNKLFLDFVPHEEQAFIKHHFDNKIIKNKTDNIIVMLTHFLATDGIYREILWQMTPVVEESVYYLAGIMIPQTQAAPLTTEPTPKSPTPASNETHSDLLDKIQQLELSVQQTNQFFELTLQSKNEGLLDWDLQTNKVTYSSSWKSLLGYWETSKTINAWHSRIHPSDYAKVSKDIKNCLDNITSSYDNRHRLQHQDGSYRWIHSQGIVIKDRGGQPLRFLINFADITERIRLEQTLVLYQKYQTIFLEQNIAVLLVDSQGHILEANPAAKQLYDYSLNSLLQLKITDICPTEIDLAFLARTTMISISYHQKNHGVMFPAEMAIGEMTWQSKKQFVLTVRDITEETQTTECLTDSEMRLRSLFEAQADALIIFEVDTLQIIDVNPAATALYGYDRSEWLNLTMTALLHDTQTNLIDFLVAATQPIHHIPLHWHKRKDNIIIPVDIATGTFSFKDKTLICAAVRDISIHLATGKKVQKTQAIASQLIEAAPVFFAVFSPTGKINFCNQALLQTLGYHLEELIDQNYYFFLPEDERALVAENVAALLSQREKSTFSQNSLLTKNGQLLRVEWHASVVINEQPENEEQNEQNEQNEKQKVAYILSVGIDIGKRQEFQSQLRLFKRIVEVSNEAIFIYTPDGQLVYANQAHNNLFRYSADKLHQYSYCEHCTEEALHKINNEVANSIALGNTWEGVLTMLNTQGRRFPVWGRFDAIRDDKGQILFNFGLMHDASEQQAWQTKLRYEHEQYETIFNAAPLMIIYKDLENRVIRVNRFVTELLNTPAEQLQGKSAYELIPEYAEQYYQNDLTVINTGQPKLGLIEAYAQGYVQTDRIPYRDANGQILGVIVFAFDITARIKAEKLLKHKYKTVLRREHWWQKILDQLPRMVIAYDANHQIKLWNKACEQVSGYTAAEIIDNPNAWQLLYPHAAYREDLLTVVQEFSHQAGSQYNHWQWQLTDKAGQQKTIVWTLAAPTKILEISVLGIGKEVKENQEIIKKSQTEQFQQALQTNVARMRFVIENLPIMVGALDEPGHIVFWNRHSEQVTGYTASEIVGNPHAWQRLYPDEAYRQKVRHIWQKVIQTQRELHYFTMPITCKDGSEKKIAWSTLSDQIKIEGWAVWGVGVDMTAYEKRLQEQEEKVRKLVKNLPVMITAYNERGQLIEWNSHCEKVTGYTATEVISKPKTLEKLYLHSWQCQQLAHKNWPNNALQPVETNMITRNGSSKIIAWHYLAKNFPITGWYHWLIGEDITATQILPTSHDKTCHLLSSVLNHLEIPLCITDDSAKFIYMNQIFCQFHGRNHESLKEQQFTNIMPRDSRPLVIRDYFKFLNNNHSNFISQTYQIKHTNGQQFKITANMYRSIQSTAQAYVLWLVTSTTN